MHIEHVVNIIPHLPDYRRTLSLSRFVHRTILRIWQSTAFGVAHTPQTFSPELGCAGFFLLSASHLICTAVDFFGNPIRIGKKKLKHKIYNDWIYRECAIFKNHSDRTLHTNDFLSRRSNDRTVRTELPLSFNDFDPDVELLDNNDLEELVVELRAGAIPLSLHTPWKTLTV